MSVPNIPALFDVALHKRIRILTQKSVSESISQTLGLVQLGV